MKYLRQALISLVILTLLTGVIYPLFIYGIGKVFFSNQANGSLIEKDGQIIGSSLIGQQFSQAKYFWSRPSATSGNSYNGLASGGSNLGPLNPQLVSNVQARTTALESNNPDHKPIPVDLVTASGSGLDPEISLAGAEFQIPRIAQARNVKPEQIQQLINQAAEYPLFGLIGEARVNVLKLNLALDQLSLNLTEQK
ncbi:MAG: Potassium-transporting ATPase KdpC subunit [Pseudomonadota bacterium]|nr:Potassium-transporting ATPase KdpC subunit [Pseudomonadota bacterium]